MDNKFEIFKDTSDEELFEIYKDIIGSELMGTRPRSLDKYVRTIQDICDFAFPFSQGADWTDDLYYKEVAKRFFDSFSKSKEERDCNKCVNGENPENCNACGNYNLYRE